MMLALCLLALAEPIPANAMHPRGGRDHVRSNILSLCRIPGYRLAQQLPAEVASPGRRLRHLGSEITATQAEITFLIWFLQNWYPAVQQEAHAATAYKTMLMSGTGSIKMPLPVLPAFASSMPAVPAPGVLTRVFNQVVRIKASPNYTEAIGQDLGIITTVSNVEYAMPDITASVEQGQACQQVRLGYIKHGHDGLHIESRRNGGDWEFLAINMVKPHLDDRPLLVANTPEHREYRARWWDKGTPNGEYSSVQRVAVGA